MNVKYISTWFILTIILLITSSCSDNGMKIRQAVLENQLDSIAAVADDRAMQIDRMTDYFDSVSGCLDSITFHEHLLLPVIDPETNRRYSRVEIRERLELLGQLIARQRERIRLLTDSLTEMTGSSAENGMSNTVLFLTQQLEEKEARVAQLKKELNDKNRSIEQLNNTVSSLSEELQGAKEQNSVLAEAVVAQSEMMNESYVLIASKKELQNMGVLTKGNLFKKSEFNPAGVKLSQCQKVDIRNFLEVPLNSSSPKILSAVPSGSYRWLQGSQGKTLVIDNPTAFWSLSSILIIQL